MQERFDIVQRPQVIDSFDRFGNYYSEGSSAEFTSSRLWDVYSFKNPKPWDSRTIAPHAYKKMSVMIGKMSDLTDGIYILEPYRQHVYSYGRRDVNYRVFSRDPLIDYDSSAVFDKTLQKMLEKVRGEHANIAVDLAEARKTLQMLREAANFKKQAKDFFSKVVKSRSYRKIRPGPSQNKRRLEYVSGKWLEYRYGWMPLLSSIWSIGDALLKKHFLKYTYLKCRSGSTKKATFRDGYGSYSDPQVTTEVTGSYRVEMGCFFNLPTGFQVNDWTSLNPASIAWELVPFSFVADWFVNVGQCLENWENWFTYRNNFVSGYVASSYKESRSHFLVGQTITDYVYNYSPYYGWYPRDGAYSRRINQTIVSNIVRYDRSVLVSLPAPGGPRVNVNLNSKRFLDTAALIGQVFRIFK